MTEVQGRRGGGARLAIWLTLCGLGALHVFVPLMVAPTLQALCLGQLAVSLALGLTGALALRLGAGWTLGGLFVNLALSVVVLLAGAAMVVAGFH
jgi:hypothetical protein